MRKLMKYCVFFNKNKRAVNVAVFDSEDSELAHFIKAENKYADFIFSDENIRLYSTYDGEKFTDPTDEWIANFNETGNTD